MLQRIDGSEGRAKFPVLRSSDGQRCRMGRHTDVQVDISSIDRYRLNWVGDDSNITAHKDVCTMSSAIEIRNDPSYSHVNPLLIRLRHIDSDRKDIKFLPGDKLSNCEIQQNGHISLQASGLITEANCCSDTDFRVPH